MERDSIICGCICQSGRGVGRVFSGDEASFTERGGGGISL
jgi:hypothetical protein